MAGPDVVVVAERSLQSSVHFADGEVALVDGFEFLHELGAAIDLHGHYGRTRRVRRAAD